MDMSKELLLIPHALARDIAYMIGFQYPSYFTRTFLRMPGASPTHYREGHKPH